jgi:1-deoxy-D-xylulose-5-phosphate reductoisomerase
LGATGSIGASAVEILARDPDRFRIVAVTAARNARDLARVAHRVGAKFAAIADSAGYAELKTELSGSGIETASGEEAIVAAAEQDADYVIAAITGAAGLKPTLAAVSRGAVVAIANKECLVCAGSLFMRRAANAGATILPVDSEHNALFQALAAGRREHVRRAILTASGGPFRSWSLDQMRVATPEQALRHPNWSMGPKVTIDSATMMNKGLELIEAHHLFALKPDEIDILVHPQSIVHGLIEYHDGSLIAQMSSPDMKLPIAHCLAWPDRLENAVQRLDLAALGTLTFERPDPVRFPALGLARAALTAGDGTPTVLNAANEVAVVAFLEGRLGFAWIAPLVAETIERAQRLGIAREPLTLEDALSVDHISRSLAADLLPEIAAKAS